MAVKYHQTSISQQKTTDLYLVTCEDCNYYRNAKTFRNALLLALNHTKEVMPTKSSSSIRSQ